MLGLVGSAGTCARATTLNCPKGFTYDSTLFICKADSDKACAN